MDTTVNTKSLNRSIILLRSCWAALFIFGLNAVTSLGTSPWILTLAAALGISIATRLSASSLRLFGFFLLILTLWIVDTIAFITVDRFFGGLFPSYFSLDVIKYHFNLSLIIGSLAALSTWFFWRLKSAITIEATILISCCIALFAGHRNFHFDRPKILNTLAWQLNVSHLAMLLGIGGTLLTVTLAYLYVASQTVRPKISTRPLFNTPNKGSSLLSLLVLAIIASTVYGVIYSLFLHFNSTMLARVANGVGMGSQNGVSPLSFESALGSTNQPAALVRLEGDYKKNPFSPMLYLRESALSSFNGHEMVFAGTAYDSDLPGIKPNENFTGKEDSNLTSRTPLVQSIYTLADHETAFAVDYPLSIVQLKNPKPNRFKSAYRAYSSAPGFHLGELTDLAVGDSRWTEEVRQHYLKPHSDLRYKDLAVEITKNADTPIDKATALATYLSRTAIYTLSPKHDVKKNEDQVAPFLFGDKRGYCVHFAHAVAYMARALGIPSRIGTGYLTDLSQSKDGHILLLMSDRHAWAEVYVDGYGWIPFDVQPDQVESHADNTVDPKLLEELMGMLDPGEEILSSETTKNEPGVEEPPREWLPNQRSVVLTIILGVTSLLILKCFIRFGWRILPAGRARTKWAYRSITAVYEDHGFTRNFGETRSEFASRQFNGACTPLTNLFYTDLYARSPQTSNVLENFHSQAVTPLKLLPRWQRILGVLNPSSVFTFLSGGRW